ncbi:MAG: response regulator transcription factor [Halioglobus sp.]
MKSRVLIIDDDKELCALLAQYLDLQGFEVDSVHDGADAISHLQHKQYDALVLDVMLPGLMGLDVLRKLREFTDTPVLMLTARGEDTDRIVGLEMGADDYLPKPCNPRELAARLRAILRRSKTSDAPDAAIEISIDDTHLNSANRTATHNDAPLNLTSAEFNLLKIMMQHAGKAVDKDTLSQEGLGRPLAAYDRSIDVHISKIRRKLADAGGDNLIISVRGLGYQFAVVGGS